MSSHKTIVFVSNPFGYGPTGTLTPLIKEFEQKTNLSLVFLGSDLCLEVIGGNKSEWKRLKTIRGDERNVEFLSSSFSSLSRPHVISSVNRFAIKVASRAGIPNALIDPLSWFWQERPEGFNLADIYFYNNFGRKLTFNNRLSYEIPLVVSGQTSENQTNSIIFNIGGARNPLVNGLQWNYLKLLILLVKELAINIQKRIIITGGNDALKFLKKENDSIKSACSFKNLNYFEFEKALSSSSVVITPSGMGVTFSAAFLQKPTVIYLPQNLSQVKLSKIVASKNITPYSLMWQDYVKIREMDNYSEAKSILEIDGFAAKVIGDSGSFKKLLKEFSNLVDFAIEKRTKPNVTKLNFGGEDFIFKTLIKNWRLND